MRCGLGIRCTGQWGHDLCPSLSSRFRVNNLALLLPEPPDAHHHKLTPDSRYVYQGQAVLPASWQSAFNIISSVGQFFGGFLCSHISDRVGRKKALALGIIICSCGIIGQIVTTSKGGFLGAKLVLGLGLGFYLTLGPLCCSEITPVVLRGISTAGVNLGIALGQLISNGIIKGFGQRTDRWAYRGPFAIQLFFAAFLAVGLLFAPESPWWLVRQGRAAEARKSLRKLYGSDDGLDVKLAAIQATIDEELTTKQGGWLDCFRGTNRIRTGISCGVFTCQHLVGIIFVFGYSTYFFELAGLKVAGAFNLGVGVTACGVAGNICSWFVINSYGRRKVFLLGMGLLTGILFVIGIMDVIPTSGAKWVQASFTVIYAFIYFLTIGAMAFAILGETSFTALRARTTAFATATQAMFGIAMNFAIPYMVNPDEGNMKGKVGLVFGGLALVGTLGSFFYVPELKGRTFNEIDTMFFNHVKSRKMGTYVVDQRKL